MLGTAIYTIWRSQNLIVFHWYAIAGLIPVVAAARHALYAYRSVIPQPLLYSLPDALWVYSFTAALVLIWRRESVSLQKGLWLLLPSMLALGAEFGQALHLMPGTFDWSDVIAYIFAGVLGSTLPRVSLTAIRAKSGTEQYVIA